MTVKLIFIFLFALLAVIAVLVWQGDSATAGPTKQTMVLSETVYLPAILGGNGSFITPTPPTPTVTPTPDFPFKVVEGPVGFPTTNSWLSIIIGLTTSDNVPVGGLKVVGNHNPSGIQFISPGSCFDFCKVSGIAGTVKFGNVTFEPPFYETGIWNLYVIDSEGTRVSNTIPVNIDANVKGWYFILLQR